MLLAGDGAGGLHGDAQDVPIKEDDGAAGLVLGGGADVQAFGQMLQEHLQVQGAQVRGVFFVVKIDVTPYPVDVRLAGARAVVAGGEG